MLADLETYSQSEEAFTDRLPYVLDLLVGVRRQLDSVVPRSGKLRAWWIDQLTSERRALSELRHAQLKRLETNEAPSREIRTNVPAGEWRGHPVNAGDTVTWIEWYFASGHHKDRPVREVLAESLLDLRQLVDDFRRRMGPQD